MYVTLKELVIHKLIVLKFVVNVRVDWDEQCKVDMVDMFALAYLKMIQKMTVIIVIFALMKDSIVA